MELKLAINLDNAAFHGDSFDDDDDDGDRGLATEMQLHGIFSNVAFLVGQGQTEGRCRDINGNTVGSWRVR